MFPLFWLHVFHNSRQIFVCGQIKERLQLDFKKFDSFCESDKTTRI